MIGAAKRSTAGNTAISRAVNRANRAPSAKAIKTACRVMSAAAGKVPSATPATKAARKLEGRPMKPSGRAPLCAVASQTRPQRTRSSRRPAAMPMRCRMAGRRYSTATGLTREPVARSMRSGDTTNRKLLRPCSAQVAASSSKSMLCSR